MGEIESRLLKHGNIKEAAVVANEDAGGNKYLCAYIVTTGGEKDLKEYLSRFLPDYMVPGYFIKMERIPLTPNGKIDRSALPDPEQAEWSNDTGYAPAGNTVEEKLVETWEKVLGKHPIGIHENFFMIGGDSIKAIRVTSRMNQSGYRFDMRDLFRYPTISGLAPLVGIPGDTEAVPATTGPPFTYKKLPADVLERLTKKYPVRDIYPLTPMQEGMLFHTLYDTFSPVLVNQFSLRFHEEANVRMVEKSIGELIKRYDILRTVFIYAGVEDIEIPLQLVLKERPINVYYKDISELTTADEKESQLARLKEKDRQTPFDLSKDVLIRVAVIKLDLLEYELSWTTHTILLDGWSRRVLFLEYLEIYNSFLRHREYRLPPVTPFKTYIQWLENMDRDESKSYWQKYLAGYDEMAAVPKMKTPGDKGAGFLSERVSVICDEKKTSALSKLANQNQITLNILFQTIWGIVLGKYADKNDAVFGNIVSGRPPGLHGIETMVGLFTNMVPVRIRFGGHTTFAQLVRQVHEDAFNGEPHHYYPLVDIQAASALKQRLFDHFYVFGNFPDSDELQDVVHTGADGAQNLSPGLAGVESVEQTTYDLTVYAGSREVSAVFLVYNANVYSKHFMEKVVLHIEKVMDIVIENENIRVKDIEISTGPAPGASAAFDGTQPDFDF